MVETVVTESVAGLEPGSAVKYRGVIIGQVSRISFADVKYAAATPGSEPQSILVEMSLDPEKLKPLTADQLSRLLGGMVTRGLRAQLSQSLLSGVTVIEINYLDPKMFPPPKLAWTPNGLFIPSAPSPMNQVVGGLEKLVAQLDASDLPGVIHHIDGLVGDVDKGVTDLQTATLREKAVALLDEVCGSNRHLSASLQELRELIASQSDNIRVLVNNLRDISDSGRGVVEDMKQNPSRLILGSPPPQNDPKEHQ
jgi:paraquat-inducible protein B